MPDASAIQATRLTKIYPPPNGRLFSLKRTPPGQPLSVAAVDLNIPRGELFGLLGPNGAGKTTLVKMLCTLIAPTSGSAVVAGHQVGTADERIRAATGLVVTDERSFYWRLSGWRNLIFFAALHGYFGREADGRVRQVLEAVDLTAVAKRPFSSYSSGMKQRLAIARALLHQPQILFLDEPSRSLDPLATARLHALITTLRQQMTIFLITHDLREAEALCDRVGLMVNGRLRTVGTPAALRAKLLQRRRYQIKTPPLTDSLRSRLAEEFSEIDVTLSDKRSTLELWDTPDGERLNQLLALLLAESHIQTITSTPPTLGDVFTHAVALEQEQP